MNYTPAQLKVLSTYEEYLRTATFEKWSRNPGRRALEIIAEIYKETRNLQVFSLQANCNTCVLNLLADVGRLYFADLKEIEAEQKAKREAAEAKKVEIRIYPDTGDYHPAEEKPEATKKVGTTTKAKTVKKKAVKTAKTA